MSFPRLIFYSAMVGGWAAFVGWLLCEVLLLRRGAQVGDLDMVLTAALVGSLVGGGLNFLAGAANGPVLRALPRLAIGFAVGLFVGAVGCLLGNLVYLILPRALEIVARALGWIVMGLGIGAVEGLTDLSLRKLRNGLIGGAVGGLLGGLFFTVVFWIIGNPMSSRAVALVVLGMCIGLSVGLAQVMLREAALTVEAGFRPGRQLLLSSAETFLGTSEKAQLCFIAYGAQGVEPLHLCILRQPDGSYWLRDNGSRSGTFVNEQPVRELVRLASGDVIRLGINKVRFNERFRAAGSRPAAVPGPAAKPAVPVAQAIRAALPVAAPVVAVQAQPVHAIPVAPSAAPAPAPRPAPSPAPDRPPAPADQPVRGTCPICGHTVVGLPGMRRCGNCDSRF
jgi:hypothetical protein